MGIKKTLLLASALALSAFAAPLPECPDEAEQSGGAGTTKPALTAEDLIAIAPKTKSCTGSDGGQFPEECRDAEAAAIALNKAFQTYNVTSTGEQAAIVAYELFESGDFKFSHNHFPEPGKPGQGTRMMAMPPYVELYATSVAGADAVAKAKAVGGPAGLEAVLALVNSDDERSFGSGAWFVTSQCTATVRAGLQAETVEGWHNFLTECVDTKGSDDRDAIWMAAKQIMLGD